MSNAFHNGNKPSLFVITFYLISIPVSIFNNLVKPFALFLIKLFNFIKNKIHNWYTSRFTGIFKLLNWFTVSFQDLFLLSFSLIISLLLSLTFIEWCLLKERVTWVKVREKIQNLKAKKETRRRIEWVESFCWLSPEN